MTAAVAVMSSTRTGSLWRARSRPRRTATRSSSARSCAACSESGAVVFDEAPVGGALTAARGLACPRACARCRAARRPARRGRARDAHGRGGDRPHVSTWTCSRRLVEIDEAALLDQLEAAVEASLLRESTDQVGRFTFEHALINHTLYEGLGGSRRARIHQRIAEALEDLYGTDSDEQLGRAGAALAAGDRVRRQDQGGAVCHRAPGERALDSLAPSEAAKLFADALELLGTGDTVERCEALIGLGEAQRQTVIPRIARRCSRRPGSRRSSTTPSWPPGPRCEQPRCDERHR